LRGGGCIIAALRFHEPAELDKRHPLSGPGAQEVCWTVSRRIGVEEFQDSFGVEMQKAPPKLAKGVVPREKQWYLKVCMMALLEV